MCESAFNLLEPSGPFLQPVTGLLYLYESRKLYNKREFITVLAYKEILILKIGTYLSTSFDIRIRATLL